MSNAQPVAFSRFGAFTLIAVGFALFLALIWLIAAGEEFGSRGNNGDAHAAATGLNGYAALVRLLDAEGYDVSRSRSPAGLETYDLLVLTPPAATDPEELAALLKKREEIGPTLVILPKWDASLPPPNLPEEAREKFKPGWVTLGEAYPLEWAAKLPAPYTVKHTQEVLEKDEAPDWEGMGEAGSMPTRTILYAEDDNLHEAMITDAAGHTLALKVVGKEGSDYYDNAHWTFFIADADLANNYGLADADRAAATLALVSDLSYDGDITGVTFDMTLNGFGASENLLTLAFRPPFLAATLCLLMALLIVGWRAFQRFGPAAADGGPAIAFGKQRLIANGASLIVRARRLQLLALPYAALSARRIADKLGLARPDREAIDAALARRLPNEEPFTRRAARMEAASKPAEILAAAQALEELNSKLSQGK
ncbi:MAG TPA: DUF4350 domain-containing protein [Erythrobacter sp.]|nr:DUF4350 domain-containing protein [Erythrobacter sp.]